jgi:hypothetical protein
LLPPLDDALARFVKAVAERANEVDDADSATYGS